MAQQQITARQLAVKILDKADKQNLFVSELLKKELQKTTERHRATDLVTGTVRNRAAIDFLIENICRQKIRRIKPKLINIVRVAVYEMLYNPLTVEYAILDEAVGLAKRRTNQRAAGFVNACLRNFQRSMKERDIKAFQLSKDYLPTSCDSGAAFTKDVLPDPKGAYESYLSVCFSLPTWLVHNWVKEFGKDKALQICKASNRKPAVYIRPNSLKIRVTELRELLAEENVETQVIEEFGMLKLVSSADIAGTQAFKNGLFMMQDLTACKAVKLLRPARGARVLDLCAAPGTKTTQLAEMSGDGGGIIATDIDYARRPMIEQNISRLGLKSVKVIDYEDAVKMIEGGEKFDCILADVPCSNTGVLAKRPEVRYRITPQAVRDIVGRQVEILEFVHKAVKAGGRLCYSTCSIQPDENSQVINKFLSGHSEFEISEQELTLPCCGENSSDGGFAAVMVKK